MNLVSFKKAKRLNARQARSALFFNRFVFTLAFHPESKNQKADALSPQHDVSNDERDPEPMHPSSRIVAP